MKSLSSPKNNYSKIKKGWLITWENDGDHAKVENKFVAIISSRYSENTIKRFLEQYYACNYLSMYEQFACIKSNKNCPKIIQNTSIMVSERLQKLNSLPPQISNTESLIIGDNPFLWARIVQDVETWTKDDNIECLIWKEKKPPVQDGKETMQNPAEFLEEKYLELKMT